ncbi:aprataxin and PNK-like factor isoform X2 [Hyposmocoma kahamanoa]|uniref:aprataxin and PNK-like factor isoform X2 n=1 Tax=Hyposmocoma kahamanoa TaxID=1477025 RepID=UPI000E6D9A0C|nr:aprataxin and PNK-like factor isoform X2 [Hyposmocoma kahamanoa]
MVFKLLRTDTEEPQKIQLPLGTHLIGRGKLLDCEDKRVSRNHGELNIVDDSITIKALHQNPCFYVKKGTDQTQVLKINCTASLCNGDKFGLLPDSYWYEVLHCTSIDLNQSPELSSTVPDDEIEDQASRDSVRTINGPGCDTQVNDTNGALDNEDRPESPSLIRNGSPNPENVNMLELPSPAQKPESSSLMERTGSPSLLTSTTDDPETTENQDNPIKEPKSPCKRCQTPDSSDAKRVKTEPVEDQQMANNDPVTVKQEPDIVPGPSNDQVDASKADDGNNTQPSPAKPPSGMGRERCMYGANCYRRNPQHKTQFAHPSDADWGVGERGVCPWGLGCRRRNPRHWANHDHPPGAQRPGSPPPAKGVRKPRQKRKKQSESDSDEDISSSDLIVTGKRTRKPVVRDVWNDTESDQEDDPYGTDESDDWVPTTDDAESQYTQTQNMLDD